ncbi:MAG: cellobiose phosphorylase, partial [Bacilli bacterium]|nr:cellobiose phosphorylase [Bacilli bacterium]
MKEYYFKNNEFIIENYDQQKTFSSFLPGVAGKRGIPLWAFYVNRGQGITSFGLQDKNTQILEFNPAVTAYQSVATDGFRTFIKIDNAVHELFGENDLIKKRYMKIKRSEFSVVEENESLGVKIEVVYFGLPNENIAALVRQVKITNMNQHALHIELFDGVSQLFPYQVSNSGFNSVGNLLRSWMEVFSLENNIGYYRMRSSSSDTAEVVETKMGNFYLSSFNGKLVKPIVDSRLIFDYDTSKRFARYFEKNSLQD